MLFLLVACTSPTGKPLPDGDDTAADSAADSAETATDSTRDDTGDTTADTQETAESDSGDTVETAESGTDTGTDPCPPSLGTGAARGSDAPALHNPTYDYAPAILHDGSYRMWWCGGVAGDHILYAEADSLDGPWHSHSSSVADTWDDVFQPTGSNSNFDGAHTCDPSVVRVAGTYYMYYGGYPDLVGGIDWTTRIGVASSPDGFHWTRLNGGAPIINPARDWHTKVNVYGAGQPSAVWRDGYFYVSYTDTTGVDVDGNGAGQFALRSADPTFQSGVEELTASGFAAFDAATHTHHALVYAFGVDWQYVDALHAWGMAIDGERADATVVHLFNDTLTGEIGQAVVPGSWTEGPGIVSRPDKHAIPAGCGTVPFDIMRSVGPSIPEWELAHDGVDVSTGLDCSCVDVPAVYEGQRIAVSGFPLTVVEGGTRLQFALSDPALLLSRSEYPVDEATFYAIPYGASLYDGNLAWGADGRPGAFYLDDGRLWPVSCPEILTANHSSLTWVDAATWDSVPIGPPLYCLQ